MSDFYDTDILAWSERQSALLRRVAAGERLNDQVDWENVVEEIDSVGRNELNAVTSLLYQAIRHELKAAAWPHARDAGHWQDEARSFRGQAALRFEPSMRRRIDISDLYARALRSLQETIDGQPALPLPPDCELTLDGLLGEG